MAITTLVIVSFQSWWLKSSYDNEKQLLKKETSMMLRETAFELQFGSLLEKKSRGDGNDVMIFEDDDVIRRRRSGPGDGPPAATQVYVSITTDSISPVPAEPSVKHRVEWKSDSLHFRKEIFLRPVSEKNMKATFREKLNSAGLTMPVLLYRVNWDDTLNKPGGFLTTAPVPAGIDHRMAYRAAIGNYSGVLLRRLWPQIAVSAFIVLITFFSFLILYRNLRNQQRLTEQKNQFISNITHELKTPIATVSVAIEAIQNFNAGENPEKRREYLEISQKELQRLSLLVDKVLKLSMFENNKLELNKEPVDLHALAQEVTGSMRLQFEKCQADVDLVFEGDDFRFDADRLHIASVLFNLLDNALKYSGDRPVIRITLRDKGKELELEVRDNGIGIPPAYTKKIFEKFFRVPQGDRHNVKGYGLGLSYVAGIVQKHGGTIGVDSSAGKGSSFTITLPRNHG
ncbi:MAG: integral membrane sensor signal transduction histidine kinase [Bacteroidetes bacterium]|nr:MAG: integral membrane sensor signal transduction histidine kinase [Bacteroidota bacterium]